MNKLIYVLVAVLLLVGGFYALNNYIYTEKQGDNAPVVGASYKDISYLIEDETVLLKNGSAETEAAPGSITKIVTEYFGNEATGDLNGDGVSDIAFLLTQTAGGTGTFFYVVAALKTDAGYKGTNAILLGDRVAPQTTEIRNGELIVNYADRQRGEPMTTQPSLGISKYLKVTGTTLAESR